MDRYAAAFADKPLSRCLLMRVCVIVWGIVFLAVAIKFTLNSERHTIFPILASAADHWWTNQPLYADYEPLDTFRYPPPFAVAVSPFAWLGPTVGSILWTWLGMGVYAYGLWRFIRRVGPDSWDTAALAAFLILSCVGALRGFWNAQANALVTGLLLLGTEAWIDRRWWSSSWYLAGAIAVKLTPLAPVLLLCALKPKALTGRIAALLLLFALLPFLTRPPEMVVGHYQEWFTHLTESARERWPGFRDAWTIYQVYQRQVAGLTGIPSLKGTIDAPLVYRILQLGTAGLALAWCLWQVRQPLSRELIATRTLGMGMAWLMLFGPSTEHPTYVFLAPFLAIGLVEECGVGWKSWLVRISGLLILVFGWGGVTEVIQERFPWTLTALPFGTAIFIVWLVVDSLPARTPSISTAPDNVLLRMPRRAVVERQLAA